MHCLHLQYIYLYIYLTKVSESQNIAPNVNFIREEYIEKIWKETVVALFEILSWRFRRDKQKSQKNFGLICRSPRRYLNPGLPQ